MKLDIVDVFAERQWQGNQLAVVRDCAHLSATDMQDIAREMNFSETTFVLSESASGARVRIFTPEWELPFAGHPTLGTAWVIAAGRETVTLDLDVGKVDVEFVDGVAWMTPPDVAFHGEFDQSPELIGLDPSALAPEYPVRLAEVGPKFVLIGVRTLADLKAASLNGELHAELVEAGVGVQCVFVFSAEPYGSEADFSSRMFFNSGGVREDPATGSANTAFAAYLRDLAGNDRTYVVDQGVEIKRPSRLYLDVGPPLRVGGKVFAVSQGQLFDRDSGT